MTPEQLAEEFLEKQQYLSYYLQTNYIAIRLQS